MKPLTKEQAIVITGYTMITACRFSDLHADVEKRLSRPVSVHEFANEDFIREVKEAYRLDFLDMTRHNFGEVK